MSTDSSLDSFWAEMAAVFGTGLDDALATDDGTDALNPNDSTADAAGSDYSGTDYSGFEYDTYDAGSTWGDPYSASDYGYSDYSSYENGDDYGTDSSGW